MHLATLLTERNRPAAGVYLALTRRCPLSCAHCSTSSSLASEEHSGESFLRFVGSFTPSDHPKFVLLTGGEALLRPRLVTKLTQRAHAAGSKVYLISGMFFARQPRIPAPIADAIDGVDHFAASLDVFHEQQVPRAAVFSVIRALLDRGKDVSFQVVGRDEDDPYLSEVTADICRTFQRRVPVVVSSIGPVGRARDWLEGSRTSTEATVEPFPCPMATWPVVSFDGTVVACCNQDAVDGRAPAHLRLGTAAQDSWRQIRERSLTSPMLRAIRVYGPEFLAARYGSSPSTSSPEGYCATCHRLSADTQLRADVERIVARPTTSVVERLIEDVHSERIHEQLIPAYAPLLRLGYEDGKTCVA